MIKGLYSAASAMVAGLNRQQLLAHNVANLDTPGFKQVLTSMTDFEETPVVVAPGNITHADFLSYVGKLGLGVQTTPEKIDFSPGAIKTTAEPLDLAINGSGFFRIGVPAGERYSRDGRFNRDLEGNLVTIDGFHVLDENGQPIQIGEGEVAIGQDGALLVNGQQAAKLGLATFLDPTTELQRAEGNVFQVTTTGAPILAANVAAGQEIGGVQQGSLEMTNVNPATLMTQMVTVQRSYQAAQQMVQNQDALLGQTISTLGRIG